MQSQAKAPKLTCLTARGNIEGFVKFQGTNKYPYKGEELNSLVTNAVKEILKTNKCLK